MNNDLYIYTLRQADNAMILCQRLCQWVAKGPELEEDIALTNIGLDMIGQARSLYQYAAEVSDQEIDEDDLAFMRDERQWSNLLLVEQPNGNFADTIARQYFYDVWHLAFLQELVNSKDDMLAAIAAKSVKEASYHVRHSASWVKRLGDGTELSHERMQSAVNEMWQFTPEMFESDDLDQRLLATGYAADLSKVKTVWDASVTALLKEATLKKPEEAFLMSGGRQGMHTQHMGYLLAEMQILPRSMPGCDW
jgi:ring-1,2-phenylacetyl-CoA epoxidase subunit PaaC